MSDQLFVHNRFDKLVELLAGAGLTLEDDGSGNVTLSPLGMLTKDVSGLADVTLTAAESKYNTIQLTGAITGNINVIVTAMEKPFILYNHTSGSYTVTIKTAAGAGIVVATNKSALLFGDGVRILRASADVTPTS